ncbi:acetylglutamate kinase [Gallaecimonas sp. GXIMD4217]|uniref:acetylglutamate kinase n=1 Tax=Gallaecimonas sp. GXIMD4217 TaxID=3131927 RepID=UPI00311AE100
MKPLVVKLGGSALDAIPVLEKLLLALNELPRPWVLVHGGGRRVDEVLKQAGIEPQKKNGKRITCEQSLPLVAGTLAGEVNKKLVAKARSLGLEPIGLSLADGIAQAEPLGEDWGAVGKLVGGNPAPLTLMLDGGFVPFVSSISADAEGKLLNINADEAAVKVAELLQADLLLLTDVTGVLDGKGQLLPRLDGQAIASLKAQSVISGGMVVKVEAALDAAKTLGQGVRLASWRQPHQLQAMACGDSPFGTLISA